MAGQRNPDITPAVAGDRPDRLGGPLLDLRGDRATAMVPRENLPGFTAEPELSLFTFPDGGDTVALDRIRVRESFADELDAVESDQPVLGSQPEKTVPSQTKAVQATDGEPGFEVPGTDQIVCSAQCPPGEKQAQHEGEPAGRAGQQRKG